MPASPQRRRVLHLITTLDRGGAENALLHLVRTQSEGGLWAPAVAFLKGRGELAPEFEAAGAAVTALDLADVRIDRAYPRAAALRRAFAPDVVHTHLFKADCLGAAILAGLPRGRPALISTKHNEDMYLAGSGPRAASVRAVARRVAARADGLVAISDGVAAFVREHLGDVAADTQVIRYGVPQPVPVAPSAAAEFRAAHGVPDDELLLLCVARLEPQKDHATLLAALGRLAETPRVHLVLLGRGSLADEVRSAAADLTRHRVVLAGFAEDPGPAYAAADLVAMSSRYEGLGLALVEAALHERAVVATRVGGVPEVVAHGETGLLVAPGDPAALSDALAQLLGDATARNAMAERARSLAAERFSLDAQGAATDRLYSRATGTNP